MRRSVKILCMVLSALLWLTFVFAGCGKNDKKSQQSDQGEIKQQKPTAEEGEKELSYVELKFVLYGEAPPDFPPVLEELNKKLLKDINTKIDVEYIPFADISTKTSLKLATPGEWDVIFTGTGVFGYPDHAAKGAFRELTKEEVKKYAPLYFSRIDENSWQDVLVGGKAYMLAMSFAELGVGAAFYRDDLREKYNVPEINTGEDFEAYFEAIKKNEPDMLPVNGYDTEIAAIFGLLIGAQGYTQSGIFYYDPDDTTYQVKTIFDDEIVEIVKKAAYKVKSFYEKGYLPQNPFGQKTSAIELGKAGKTSIWHNAFENYPQYAADMKSKGWKLGALPYMSKKGITFKRSGAGNGWAISPACKNYERALMVLELINQHNDYVMLVSFGIEGKNYIIRDGKLALAPGIDPSNNPFPMYSSGFWPANRDLWPPLENYTQDYIDIKKKLVKNAISHPLANFNFTIESVKTEMSNIGNVTSQYWMPITLGLVKDVDSAINEYKQKLKAAGADKVINSYKEQFSEYMKARNK